MSARSGHKILSDARLEMMSAAQVSWENLFWAEPAIIGMYKKTCHPILQLRLIGVVSLKSAESLSAYSSAMRPVQSFWQHCRAMPHILASRLYLSTMPLIHVSCPCLTGVVQLQNASRPCLLAMPHRRPLTLAWNASRSRWI
jgi:hypothetical protein